MPMPSPSAVAAQIMQDLGVPTTNPQAVQFYTAVVTRIQQMILASTVTINPGSVATGVMAGGAAVPVTGTGTIT